MAFAGKKRLSVLLILVMTVFMLGQSIVFAEDAAKGGSEPVKDESLKPFPSKNEGGTRFAAARALYSGNFGNDFVQAQVGSDGRFNAGINQLGTEDWYNIMFSWPSSPWSSFTTVKVDGEDRVYGNSPDGTFISTPANNGDDTSNDSVWRTGDVTVRQLLQPGINPATGLPDALQIRYVITNTGSAAHDVGLRMMLDTMVNGNDSAPFKVPGASGIESINYEKDYVGAAVPSFWQVFNDFNNPDISAQYTMQGRDSTPPDRFTIASWGAIQGTLWNYAISPGSYTGDSAVGMWWNPVSLAPGEQKVITTYYGRPGVGGESALVLAGRQKLSYDEWSAGSFNLISYLTNNTASSLTNVRLQLEADPGLTAIDGDLEHTIGTLASGATIQSAWKLQPNAAGTHHLTVKAYADGSAEPYATAAFQVQALEPVVPPNVTLGGSRGTTADGTPISGRTSPLTVQAHYDSPQATGVTLIATDGDGTTYTAELSSTNGVDWSHTFTPYAVGLWESPLTITLIPHYADGDGPQEQFPVELIDPSGYVYNELEGEDWRLPGATVTLQYYDPLLTTWVNMSEEAYSGRMSPITNPQVTGTDGRYAWDVAAGSYRVVVSRPGFATVTSREVAVPPPVTDLHVGLVPTDAAAPVVSFSGVQDGETYTGPVTTNFWATDDTAGVRSISYKIDDAEAVIVSGDHAALPTIDAEGNHKLVLTAVDHVGNEATATVLFTIVNPDSTAPTTTLLINSAAPVDYYNSTELTITLNAADNAGGSGVAATYYRINNAFGPWILYTGPKVVTFNKYINRLEYYSVDAAGNVESIHLITPRVDLVKPMTKYTASPNFVLDKGGMVLKGYKVTLVPQDDYSGTRKTWYRINYGAWTEYKGPFLINDLQTKVNYYSEDIAGNIEKVN
ncbi:OmpL47-type beta-barrel domain-containing protein [Paenibacillus kobensis]|uniref:OmpL47-type beta-barrel domain-containing protein n=1 Tax=Paenibacillus kobensis TaxID=59841 RepID=UPI000FDAEBD2|nr:hypothetical protein [Paenibacillus kobensis]